jgi:tetratricopeptide (TPR) repeat protein
MGRFAGAAEPAGQLRSIVRRETIRLGVLSACAVLGFIATRLLADRADQRERRDAAAWHERGQQWLPSQPARAATAFRRAVTKDRSEAQYVLSLAAALARAGNRESAERALQGLREFSPEAFDVNLALARLYRDTANSAAARRYYHHAIYAPDVSLDRARAVRLELVRMLIAHDEKARAQSELIAATVDLPDLRDVRLELARLFERADDLPRAADQYQRVLASQPLDVVAMEGAVRSGFLLGNYREVATYRLPKEANPEVSEYRDIAREIMSRDPLASRLGAAERRQRLLRAIRYIEERWSGCAPSSAAGAAYPTALAAAHRRARASSIGRDAGALEAIVAVLDNLRAQIEPRCGRPTATDRAIEIIARRHRVHEP